jgi:hypothetical protein
VADFKSSSGTSKYLPQVVKKYVAVGELSYLAKYGTM